MAELVVSGIEKNYEADSGLSSVLRGVDFVASGGQILAILGPSGSGKSTLLNIIGSLDTPDRGSVLYDGLEVTSLKNQQLADYRSKMVGFVFQDHHLLPQLTVVENVMLPSIPAKMQNGASDRAVKLLDRMGLSDKAESLPNTLSGGERQRVAVARALINGADLILCDEPTGSLDSETGSSIMSLLIEITRENSITTVVVTHNLEQAARLDRRLRLIAGKLVEDNLPQ